MPGTDDFVVPRVPDSLPLEYKQLKFSYTTLLEEVEYKWTDFVCIQEQERLSKKRAEKTTWLLLHQISTATIRRPDSRIRIIRIIIRVFELSDFAEQGF